MPTEAEVICQVSELGEDLRDDNTEFKSREELLLKSRIGNMGKSGTEGRVTGVTYKDMRAYSQTLQTIILVR